MSNRVRQWRYLSSFGAEVMVDAKPLNGDSEIASSMFRKLITVQLGSEARTC
jgi:hypothetical protein